MLIQDYVYNGLIINVVDGDTIDIQVDLGFRISIKERFRLTLINAAEMNAKDANERAQAIKAKAFLSSFIGNGVTFKSFKKDKYGRYLAEVFVGGETISLNRQMISNGLAKPYIE